MKTLTLFYWNQCPHCISFMPEWAKVKQLIAKKNIGVFAKEYEYNKDKKTVESYGVNAFPTLIFQDGEKTKEIPATSADQIISKVESLMNRQKEAFTMSSHSSGGSCKLSGGCACNMSGGASKADEVALWRQKYAKYKTRYLLEKQKTHI